MSLNKSIVEDAALEWFGEQTRCARTLTPALSQGEREEDGEVVQSRFARTLTQPLPGGEEKREAIRRLNPAIPEEASACAIHADRRATHKESLLVRNTSKGG
ncbi:MAG: hypothetical protein NTW21_30140 [Verrucomicrobia bacterium]|nr:hypothetical protein [Verrucomicrobiota bacterium]